MAFGGDIDTLNLLYDKMQYIFSGYDSYIKSYEEIHTLFKQGSVPDREFFEKVSDAVLKYSALGFLSIKVLFEIKKALDKIMPGVTNLPISTESTPGLSEISSMSYSQHSIASFVVAKNLPNLREPLVRPQIGTKHCSACRKLVNEDAKFCKNCGVNISK